MSLKLSAVIGLAAFMAFPMASSAAEVDTETRLQQAVEQFQAEQRQAQEQADRKPKKSNLE